MNSKREDREKTTTAKVYKKDLLEHIPAVVYVAEVGDRGKWIYVSSKIHDLLGYSPLEWMNDPGLWIRHIHPDDRPRVMEQEMDSMKSGHFSSEYRMFSRAGKEIWVRDEGSILKDGFLYYGFLFDITNEKTSEQNAREIQKQLDLERAQLEQRLRSFNKFEAVGRLAAGVAHDFNNLLMAITSYCDLLQLEIGEPVPEALKEIQRAAVEGSVLTKHLLAFGGKQWLEPRKLNINEVLKNLEPMIKRFLKEDIQLEFALAEDLGIIRADLSQLEDIIINLTMVARDSMPEGGRILLETFNVQFDRAVPMARTSMKPGNYIQLSLTDTGTGMDEESREHIFDPFYTRRDQTMAGGLRLPGVYGSVKQNNGYIWVFAEPGHGTTFRIYFPLIDAAAENSLSPTETPPLTAAAAGQTILVVDDNDAIRVAIGTYLEMNGFKILHASNGKEALQVAASPRESEIDLLITDLVMPHMGGLELSRNLAMRNSNLKVLYMSGYTEESVIRQGVVEPGAFFLQKPASMQVLLQKVRELLNS